MNLKKVIATFGKNWSHLVTVGNNKQTNLQTSPWGHLSPLGSRPTNLVGSPLLQSIRMIATNTLKDKSWRGKTSTGKSWSKNRETEQKLEQKTKRERKDLIGPGIRSWERKSWSKDQVGEKRWSKKQKGRKRSHEAKNRKKNISPGKKRGREKKSHQEKQWDIRKVHPQY